MKALTLRQPWASLVALGVKTIETRSWSTKYRGPLAIHAGAKRPPTVWLGPNDDLPPAIDRIGMPWEGTEGDDYYGSWRWAGPLGAVVATCTLVDVVPIVDRGKDGGPGTDTFVATFVRPAGLRADAPPVPDLVLVRRGEMPVWSVIEDQRPYGDFTPGRFAWLLDDVKPTTERCPACWGGTRDPGRGGRCSSCQDDWRCDPIPTRGRQRLWEWTP